MLAPKSNGKVILCLDPAGLNQALIRLVHRGLILNDVFLKLKIVKYFSLMGVSSGYHNLKLDKRSSYLTTFAYQFGRYKYERLPFGAAPTGDMVQKHEIFKDLPNVFGNADDNLVVGYDHDGKDHDDTM